MYILKNAWKSIARSKGRNILIGLIVVIIATASCVSLSIKQAAKTAEAEGLDALSVSATISVDRSAAMGDFSEDQDPEDMLDSMQAYTSLDLDELLTYAESEYVEDFVYSMTAYMNAGDDLTVYDTSDSSESDESSDETTSNDLADGDFSGGMQSQSDFTLIGYDSEDAMTDFTDGISQVTDGSVFDVTSSDLECLISNELAVLNSLSVGDTITLTNPDNEDETYTFTICGIYTNSESGSSENSGQFSPSQDTANQILTSYAALEAVITSSENTDEDTALSGEVDGTYLFADVDDYENFATAVYDMGLDENYTVSSTDVDSYEQSLVSLQNVTSFSNTLLWIVLGVGGTILIVFNIYSIRERKYEVGVLTAIGMKKRKVAAQFMTELFIVTFFALIIGTIVGAIISVPAADKLLAAQTESLTSSQQQVETNFGRGDVSDDSSTDSSDSSSDNSSDEGPGGGGLSQFGQNAISSFNNYVSDINATVDLTVVIELFGIGVLLTLLASSGAVIFILRYEPLKILSNRS